MKKRCEKKLLKNGLCPNCKSEDLHKFYNQDGTVFWAKCQWCEYSFDYEEIKQNKGE